MSNEFKHARDAYDAAPIPAELNDRVQEGIRQGQARRRRARSFRRTLGICAACFAVVLAGLNLSPTMAAAAAEMPVLGGLFQVLTVRSYETQENGANYDVTVPGVEADGIMAQRVNDEIQKRVDAHLTECRQMWEDYKEAFFATGGTEEEWGGREMDVVVDYEIKSQTDTTVSFVVDLFQGSFSAYSQQYCYNLDLAEDRDITLADVLGEDWVNLCNKAVRARIDQDEASFFPPEQGGFTTVDETTQFYLNEAGSPVLLFPKYAIAPGSTGIVEIEVTK